MINSLGRPTILTQASSSTIAGSPVMKYPSGVKDRSSTTFTSTPEMGRPTVGRDRAPRDNACPAGGRSVLLKRGIAHEELEHGGQRLRRSARRHQARGRA